MCKWMLVWAQDSRGTKNVFTGAGSPGDFNFLCQRAIRHYLHKQTGPYADRMLAANQGGETLMSKFMHQMGTINEMC